MCLLTLSIFPTHSWYVDFWVSGASRRLDLIGDFSERRNFGVRGRVWVEVKCFSEARYDEEVAKWKRRLAGELETEHRRDPSLQAVMLLAAKASRVSGGLWAPPTL